ncbi:hypothetical protein HELRODRAFT_97481 [Helobdella robusta]|uniref:SH3 domain-containing protein n=1 Tax=Helobdella robusta TaxID=6412 RepID=T1G9H0_HELRO|nr:hypothetical protein HELRODRAFT_97481 [Helobdella robusta]ESO09304.1 hypothetical protein HELRODRAFT_97481 [Helobdella robusta]
MASETLNKKENFWDIDGYKKVIKRTEDGKKMCNFLMKLIEERAHIEQAYSQKLNSWYKKWTHEVDKSPEYGTNKEMLKNFVTEADKLSDVHITMKDALVHLVKSKIKNWRDNSYGVQLCKSKPAAKFEKHFKKAQKPWANQVKKVEKLRQTYEKYCKQCDTLLDQEANVNKNDSQAYQRAKDRCELVTRQMDQAKVQYEAAVAELESLKPAYTADMSNAFAEAQEFEVKRLEFFKEILLKLQEKMNLNKDQRVQEIYGACQEYISSSNPESDVHMWGEQFGPASHAMLNLFTEVSPAILEKIEMKKQQLAAPPENLPTVTPTVDKPEIPLVVAAVVSNGNNKDDPNSLYSSVQRDSKAVAENDATAAANNNNNNNIDNESDFDLESLDQLPQPPANIPTMATTSAINRKEINSKTDKKPLQNGELDYSVYCTLNDNHIYTNEGQDLDGMQEAKEGDSAAVRVVALYDFEGGDSDELTFEKGDVFQRIRSKDMNGWSTGLKNGKSGLFPDSYVQVC